MKEMQSVVDEKTGARVYPSEEVYGQFNMTQAEPSQKQATKTNKSPQVAGDDGSFLAAGNFEHWFRIANMMASSEMVPKGYKGKPQDVLIAMEMGRKWNISPLQAIQNIAVINGKPCAYGDLVLGICSAHPDFENIEESPIKDNSGAIVGYRCSVKRKGRSAVIQEFTVEQAKEGGLWGRQGPWKTSPSRMLQMRARAFALRDSFADALMGVSVAEEVSDYQVIDAKPKGHELLGSLTIKKATESQIEVIKDLIVQSEITPERLEKAKTHFGVNAINDLTEGQANEFIAILNKEVGK